MDLPGQHRVGGFLAGRGAPHLLAPPPQPPVPGTVVLFAPGRLALAARLAQRRQGDGAVVEAGEDVADGAEVLQRVHLRQEVPRVRAEVLPLQQPVLQQAVLIKGELHAVPGLVEGMVAAEDGHPPAAGQRPHFRAPGLVVLLRAHQPVQRLQGVHSPAPALLRRRQAQVGVVDAQQPIRLRAVPLRLAAQTQAGGIPPADPPGEVPFAARAAALGMLLGVSFGTVLGIRDIALPLLFGLFLPLAGPPTLVLRQMVAEAIRHRGRHQQMHRLGPVGVHGRAQLVGDEEVLHCGHHRVAVRDHLGRQRAPAW